jgi:hypothetical protein
MGSFMKTFIMMTGELDYGDLFYGNDPIYYPELTYAIFVLLMIILSIVLANLLASQ